MKLLYSLLFTLFFSYNAFAGGCGRPMELVNVTTVAIYGTCGTVDTGLSPDGWYCGVNPRFYEYRGTNYNTAENPLCLLYSDNYKFVDECPAGQTLDDNNVCTEPPPPDFDGDGIPDSEDPDIDDDGIPNEDDNDNDNDGIPNAYDDYMGTGTSNGGGTDTPPNLEQSCKDLYNTFSLTCPEPPNKQIFNCTELDNGLAYITAQQCIADKAPSSDKSPCDAMYEDLNSICDFGIEGSCSDNGLVTVSDTLRCKDDIPKDNPLDCSSLWYESYNSSTGKCQCDDGYVRNSWGICALPDDANSTTEQLSAKHEKEASDARTKASEDNTKQINDDLTSSTDTTNATLDRIADTLDDMNSKTNGNPDDFPTDSIEQELADNQSFLDSVKNEFSTFATNVDTQLETLSTNFNDTKNIFSESKSFNVSGGSTSGCIQYTIHGKTITIDLCSSFSQFAPIVYFVFTLAFMVLVFRFMVTNLLKGLE